VLVQAWAKEQGGESKRQFQEQDVMVPWKLQKKFSEDSQSDASSPAKDSGVLSAAQAAAQAAAAASSEVVAVTADMHRLAVDKDEDVILEEKAASETVEKREKKKKSKKSSKSQNVAGKTGESDSGLITYHRYCHVYKEVLLSLS
jgi:hypothetical protein